MLSVRSSGPTTLAIVGQSPQGATSSSRPRPTLPHLRKARPALVGFAMLLLGCGGAANFGESVTVKPEKHTRLDDPLSAGTVVHLPADHSFNVSDAQRFSTGPAKADSSAEPDGRAVCSATAQSGGTAWAEFQVGHVLDHRGEKPLEATVTFRVNYRYHMDCPAEVPEAEANKFALKAYIRDSNKRVLKRALLANLEPSKGPHEWQGHQISAFDVTFEPGLAYHLVLAGRVEVYGPQERAASSEIEVSSLELDVAPRIATARGSP